MGFPVKGLWQSVASLGLMQVASMAITFAAGVLLARLLGASQYGIYALAMTVTTLVGMVTEFGLPTLLMRDVAVATATGKWGTVKALAHWADKVILTISCAIFVLFFGGYWLLGAKQDSAFLSAMLWAIFLIPMVALAKWRGLALLSLGKTFAGQFPVLILRYGLFTLILAAIFFKGQKATAATAMLAQLLAAFVALIAVFFMFRRYIPADWRNSVITYDRNERAGWVKDCIPLGMNEGLRLLQGQIAILLLGIFSTASEVGNYRVADAVASAATMGISVIATALSPVVARHWANGDIAALRVAQKWGALAMVGSSLILGLPFLLFGEYLFPLLFGPEFVDASVVFPVVFLAYSIGGALGSPMVFATMTGKQSYVTKSLAINAAMASIMALIFGGSLTGFSMAMAILISSTLSSAYLWATIWMRHSVDTSLLGWRKSH